MKNGQVTLYDVEIADPLNKSMVRAKKALWQAKEKRFVITGDYSMRTAHQNRRGSSVFLDVNLKTTPINDKKRMAAPGKPVAVPAVVVTANSVTN